MSPTAQRREAAAKAIEARAITKGARMLHLGHSLIAVQDYLTLAVERATATRTGAVTK